MVLVNFILPNLKILFQKILEIEKETNLLGYIQGGATLVYSPSFYEAKDDLGIVSKKMITDEEVTLKSGVLTWNGNTLKNLVATAESRRR